MHLDPYRTDIMDSTDDFHILLNEVSKYADESAAVSDLEEKKGIITSLLTALNRSLSSNGIKE